MKYCTVKANMQKHFHEKYFKNLNLHCQGFLIFNISYKLVNFVYKIGFLSCYSPVFLVCNQFLPWLQICSILGICDCSWEKVMQRLPSGDDEISSMLHQELLKASSECLSTLVVWFSGKLWGVFMQFTIHFLFQQKSISVLSILSKIH